MKLLSGKKKIVDFRSLGKPKKKKKGKFKQKYVWYTILVLLIISFAWGQLKPMPKGTNIESEAIYINDSDIDFLYDLTYNKENKTLDQEIFKNVFQLIDEAEEFIVIDMFLFGQPENTTGLINLSKDLKDKLVEKKKQTDIPIYFITDHFNTFYKSSKSDLIKELEENNITIIYTDMDKLRDSNPILSAPWNIFVKPFGLPDYDGGLIPNFLGEGTVSLRSVFKLLNFKANHRKVIMSEKEAIITSANPHTGSSLHSNVAVKVKSKELIETMLSSEKEVAKFSGSKIPINYSPTKSEGNIEIKYVTEKKIRDEIIGELNSATKEDKIKIGMFYISDRKIVNAIKSAAKRGVNITMVLDANKDAFGKEKNGIPGRQVAYELEKVGVKIYWYSTNGEQFHTKIFIKETNDKTIVILGSGNYTRRNIGNFNLEADLKVVSPNNTNFATEVKDYWTKVLDNVLPYEAFKDTSKIKYLTYRFQEWSGLSTF